MGIWKHGPVFKEGSSSPLVLDRKITRFQRMVEHHAEILDLFSDLKDKQSGEYILDRQYVEAQLDRAYEGARRILYDMHVICDSVSGEGFSELDRLRSVSEEILKDPWKGGREQKEVYGEEELDWEIVALQAIYKDLTRMRASGAGPETSVGTGPVAPQSLAEWAGWAHTRAAQWIATNLPSVSAASCINLCDPEMKSFCIQVFALGSIRGSEEALKQYVAKERTAAMETRSLQPICYLLDSLFLSKTDPDTRKLHFADPTKEPPSSYAVCIQLYTGEGFLMLRLPSFLPLRLFWCSLSLADTENLFYLFGTSSLFYQNGTSSNPACSEKEPYSVYRGRDRSGTWMYWASNFNWAQGEERIRVLGHSLEEFLRLSASGATHERMCECMEQSLSTYLK